MALQITEEKEIGLDGAKAHLRQAAHEVDPLRPLRQHPFTTVTVAAMSGFLLGSKEHPALMKTLRLSMSAVNLLKPAMLLAGKFAANHFAKSSTEAGSMQEDVEHPS